MRVLFYHILIGELLHLVDIRIILLRVRDKLDYDLMTLLVFCRFPEEYERNHREEHQNMFDLERIKEVL